MPALRRSGWPIRRRRRHRPRRPCRIALQLVGVVEVVEHLAERQAPARRATAPHPSLGCRQQLLDCAPIVAALLASVDATADRARPTGAHGHRLARASEARASGPEVELPDRGPRPARTPRRPGRRRSRSGQVARTARAVPPSARARSRRSGAAPPRQWRRRLRPPPPHGAASRPALALSSSETGSARSDDERDGLAEMERHELGQLVGAARRVRLPLEPRAGGTMDARPLDARQRVVRDLADQDVAERDRVRRRDPDEVAVERGRRSPSSTVAASSAGSTTGIARGSNDRPSTAPSWTTRRAAGPRASMRARTVAWTVSGRAAIAPGTAAASGTGPSRSASDRTISPA